MSDATPAYRGYRRQALYALSRILGQNNSADLIFHPEGSEDLSIYGDNHSLLEVIQVKDYTSPLQLSDFKVDKPGSFFYRAASLLQSSPSAKLFLATYGELGPELEGALGADEQDQKNVIRKLAQRRFISETEAKEV